MKTAWKMKMQLIHHLYPLKVSVLIVDVQFTPWKSIQRYVVKSMNKKSTVFYAKPTHLAMMITFKDDKDERNTKQKRIMTVYEVKIKCWLNYKCWMTTEKNKSNILTLLLSVEQINLVSSEYFIYWLVRAEIFRSLRWYHTSYDSFIYLLSHLIQYRKLCVWYKIESWQLACRRETKVIDNVRRENRKKLRKLWSFHRWFIHR